MGLAVVNLSQGRDLSDAERIKDGASMTDLDIPSTLRR